MMQQNNPKTLRPSEKQVANQPDAEDREERSFRVGAFFQGMSSFLLSTVTHMLLVIVLAMMTIEPPPKSNPAPELVSVSEDEDFEDFKEFQPEKFELKKEQAVAFTVEDPGMAELGELPAIESVDLDISGAHASNPIDQIGTLFGEHGQGFASWGPGLGGAEFYGMKARGTRFIFVVDNSLSMNKGRFESACYELALSVSKMGSDQFFYVYFFSDTAYPLFYPNPAAGMVRATDENKQKLVAWLDTVHLVLKTNARKAVESSLAMNPNAIYILTDGAFTDNTNQLLLDMKPNSLLTIHTVGMEIGEKHERPLRAIATRHHGSYRHVTTDPRMRNLSIQKPRPRHHSIDRVWGIALGNGPRKNKPKKQPNARKKKQT